MLDYDLGLMNKSMFHFERIFECMKNQSQLYIDIEKYQQSFETLQAYQAQLEVYIQQYHEEKPEDREYFLHPEIIQKRHDYQTALLFYQCGRVKRCLLLLRASIQEGEIYCHQTRKQ